MQYSQRLKELRKEHNLNQTEVADVLNIKQTVYSRYERNENEMPIKHLIQLAQFYKVTTDYILGLTDER